MRQRKINDISELPALAREIIASMENEKVIAFYGEMGAGKTTLIKVICEELGVMDTISSPTFSIVNEYRGKGGRKIYHFDFYRIKNEGEAYDLGYEEYFYSGALCLIEWPEKIMDLLPLEISKVKIVKEGESRSVSF
ncbi:MAG: tRNA (adenosine(37)-N6)-threonylcarbamoyltransferase complex ATPase subunit type 1 TsaE [Bacteroidia bacterium]